MQKDLQRNADALSCMCFASQGLGLLGTGCGTALLSVALEGAARTFGDDQGGKVFEEFAPDGVVGSRR